jgi:hypothetical protein
MVTEIVLKTVQGYLRRSLRPKPIYFLLRKPSTMARQKNATTIETLPRRQPIARPNLSMG